MTARVPASASASPTRDRPVLGVRGWEAGEQGRLRQGPQVASQEAGRAGHAPLTAARLTAMKLVSSQDLPCLVSLPPRLPSPSRMSQEGCVRFSSGPRTSSPVPVGSQSRARGSDADVTLWGLRGFL